MLIDTQFGYCGFCSVVGFKALSSLYPRGKWLGSVDLLLEGPLLIGLKP